jgi:hypothetical protein
MVDAKPHRAACRRYDPGTGPAAPESIKRSRRRYFAPDQDFARAGESDFRVRRFLAPARSFCYSKQSAGAQFAFVRAFAPRASRQSLLIA